MSLLDASQLAAYRADVAATFADTCQLGTPSFTRDTHGQAINTPGYGAEIACGFKWNSTRLSVFGGGEVPVRLSDAEMRLPFGTSIPDGAYVKLTKRHGAALATALVFQIVGHPKPGLACITLSLERTT